MELHHVRFGRTDVSSARAKHRGRSTCSIVGVALLVEPRAEPIRKAFCGKTDVVVKNTPSFCFSFFVRLFLFG